MKVRHGFVTNSSSTSFMIIYHSQDPKYRLYKLFDVIPNINSTIPIAYKGLDQVVANLDLRIANYEPMLDPNHETHDWIREAYKDRANVMQDFLQSEVEKISNLIKELKDKKKRVMRHSGKEQVVWVTDWIDDDSMRSLFWELDNYGTQDGITILRFEENR